VLSVGFSLGGHSALALAGVRVSKARFIAYCAANQGKVDCGWLEDGGVDFTQIDAALYEADLSDARITRTIAIDPALPQAVLHESLTALGSSVLIVNLGAPETIPAAMRADGLAEQIAGAEFRAIDGAAHFSALPKCSALGVVMIGLAGDDNICSDRDLRPREDVHLDVLDAIDGFLGRASQG
jgi:predicted dienelactone hydrolase